ncbi:hypothetical protein D6D17_02645 [Aureobasidium pullulans]|uniref:Uncharacterized protein n=2 Tax=Aureobasidium pullulans TaxID=5580 RepID=A0A074XL24_AURPU|nr:uncharacterized protein M438DRAFT_353363 [Aureobasidium pullulans EXF-150]KEQ86210.1 hypothetical protein M438DRAFT_353363 [Aureobasidium pullulans EXF-150]THX16913.1 hypothetical protein D6D17_02645 [Aureobasidium pullulans]THZ14086.1 hypothetical protein D6C91_07505 [Aureobasidium pullulans]
MPSGVIHNIVVNDFAMAEVELCARVFRLNAATGLFGSDKEVLECCIVLLDKRSEVGDGREARHVQACEERVNETASVREVELNHPLFGLLNVSVVRLDFSSRLMSAKEVRALTSFSQTALPFGRGLTVRQVYDWGRVAKERRAAHCGMPDPEVVLGGSLGDGTLVEPATSFKAGLG